MTRLLSLLFVCFFSLSAFAGTGEDNKAIKSIQGRVIDAKTNEALVGVELSLNDGQKVYTDFDGNFTIAVKPGAYELKASLVSYGELKLRNIKVEEGNRVLDLKLHND